MKAVCRDCSLDAFDANPADIGSALPGQIVSHLQRAPDTDYLALGYGALSTGLYEAMQSAGVGKDVTAALSAGAVPNWQRIAAGKLDAFDVSFPQELMGWVMFDHILRAATHTPLPTRQKFGLPARIIDKSNAAEFLKSGWDVEPYTTQLKKLWGLA